MLLKHGDFYCRYKEKAESRSERRKSGSTVLAQNHYAILSIGSAQQASLAQVVVHAHKMAFTLAEMGR